MNNYKFLAKKLGSYFTKFSKKAPVSDAIKRPSESITNALGAEKTKIIEAFNSKKLNKDVLVIQNKPENITKVEIKTPAEKKVVEKPLSQEHQNNATKKVLESHSESEVKPVQQTNSNKVVNSFEKSKLIKFDSEFHSGKKFDYKHYLEKFGVSAESMNNPIKKDDMVMKEYPGRLWDIQKYSERYKAKDGRTVEAGIDFAIYKSEPLNSYREQQNYYYRYVKIVNPEKKGETVEYGNIHFVDTEGYANEISMRKELFNISDKHTVLEEDSKDRGYNFKYEGCTSRMKNKRQYTSYQDLEKLNPKDKNYKWDKYFMQRELGIRHNFTEEYIENYGTYGIVADYKLDMLKSGVENFL